MTLVPPGAQLAPVDLPPPPPQADPREPSATLTPRQRGSRTPQRSRSPLSSRDASPVRPNQARSQSSELGSPPPLQHPIPRSSGIGTPSASVPIHGHHLSRPSSPSSIHSSGSAIFERDIELPPVASLSLNPNPPHQAHTLSHKASRLSHLSHGSALDHTVPAVLDDAVEALTAGDGLSRGFDGLEIEAPAPSAGLGMARQSSSSLPGMAGRKVSSGPHGFVQSRSPSPISIASKTSSVASPAQSPPIFGQLSNQQQGSGLPPNTIGGQAQGLISGSIPGSGASSSGQTSPTAGKTSGPGPVTGFTASVPRPAMPQRISTGPLLPGGWAFGGAASAPAPGVGTDSGPGVREALEEVDTAGAPSVEAGAGVEDRVPSPMDEPSPVSPSSIVSQSQGLPAGPASSSSPPAAIPSHLSPNKSKHRISYLSYNDLLLSVPTQVTSLEDITSGNLSPDHLPGTVSPSMSTRSPVIGSPSNILPGGQGHTHSPSLAAMSASTPPTLGGAVGAPAAGHTIQPRASWDAGNAGGGRLGGLGFGEGEWQREGLGKGLEQRLEEVAHHQKQAS
ncbi:hypothetical protein I317_04803 [Kwoniella heveanensis CBS 569]|uniref:Uncharacterized protein n=1 Tax=Kwoniella heveanensis BCC8398 TaxID=1296120 RepID=A0A1B9GQX5_9TREE|nr:hypothetical protein I316_05006 [Kwoniella heveanensis BCC8398]OCF41412.1 hypothetical protein I317_04803 [Kwoniella heveanensis CBS 569]